MKRNIWAASVALTLVLQGLPRGRAETGPQPAAENLEARKWFQEARFGLFVHWGVYSMLASGEWVMEKRKIRVEDYERLPKQFNPTAFNPAQWVALAKTAGMRYITITAKHHDGFAMFDSKVSDWDIVDRSPFRRDPLKMLADECRRQGLKLFFYYSQADWHHTDYFPRGNYGHDTGRPEKGDWYKYIDYMDAQVTELLTRYGRIGGIWLDGGDYDLPDADWRLDKTYALIHKLQPQALIASNHARRPNKTYPYPGEDFQTFEKHLTYQRPADIVGLDNTVSMVPLETSETINKSWGFNISDKEMKSTKDLIHLLANAAGFDANFLLNVGPMPNGQIQPEFVERLTQMGGWLKVNGESIYGTRKGPLGRRSWGVTTRKAKTIYVHILDWPDSVLAIPSVGKVVRARALKGGGVVDTEDTAGALVIKIPPAAVDPYDTVIALEVQ